MSREVLRGDMLRKRSRNPSFRTLVKENESDARNALMTKARTANRIAKLDVCRKSRAVAYDIKAAALNKGLELGLMVARSDEQWRSHLVQVTPQGGAALHLPIGKLSIRSQEQKQVRAVLGRCGPQAA